MKDVNIDFNLAISVEAQKKQYDLVQDKNPFNSLIVSKAEIVDNVEDFNLTEATVGQQDFSDDDYIIIKSIFVTSQPYVNGNKDSFRTEDIKSTASSEQLSETKPGILDLNHNFFPFGTVIGKREAPGKLIKDDEEVDVTHLEVYSVLWAWRFPDLAEKVKSWNTAGILRFSMACKAKAHMCGECGVTASKVDDYCEHLKEKTYSERILIEPKFYANSIITPDREPADSNAKALEVGEFMTVEGDSMEKFIVSYDEIYWVTRDAMSHAYSKLWGEIRDVLNENTTIVSKVKDAFNKASETYLMLFKQLKLVMDEGALFEVNLDKKKKRYDLENLPWLLRETLYDIEASGADNAEKLIARAFNDARDMFVSLWKGLEPEQRETFRNQKIIISEQKVNLNEGVITMDLSKRIAELELLLEEATTKLKEHENAETTKEITALQAEVGDLKLKLAESDTKIDELATKNQELVDKIEVLDDEKVQLDTKLEDQKELVVEVKKQEAENINTERKEKIEGMKLSDEQKEFWINEFAVSFDEESGELSDPNKAMFEKFTSKLPAEEIKESKKVKDSENLEGVHVAEVDADAKVLSNTVAN